MDDLLLWQEISFINPSSANPIKWSNTKTIRLSVFDHFVGLALEEFKRVLQNFKWLILEKNEKIYGLFYIWAWKSKSTLEPRGPFETGTPGLVTQCPNHKVIAQC